MKTAHRSRDDHYSLISLMAQFLFLLFLLSEVSSDEIVVVRPGDNATLPCQVADSSISIVDWRRPDLDPIIVLLIIDGHLDPTYQHPSFEGRVDLVDRELKDGDASLILKNVNINDTGTYECRVTSAGSGHTKREKDPIRTIRLQVTEPADLILVPVHPGQNAILPCQAANPSIRVVEWSRPDLKPEYVLYYRDGHLDPTHQNPYFKDRVELVDRELKDGDVSLILKNVNSNDNGTYECRVKPDSSRRKKRAMKSDPIRTIRIIRLQVTEPAGSQDENSSPVGLYVGLAAGGLVALVTVVGVLIYKTCKDRRPFSAVLSADQNHQRTTD